MRRRHAWGGLAASLVAALVMSTLGAVPAHSDEEAGLEPLSVAGTGLPLSLSGELVVWAKGDDLYPDTLAVPSEYEGVAFSQVQLVDNAVIALTAAGRVVGWGANQYRLQQIPAAVTAAKVVQLTSSAAGFVGAVTADGRVLVWGVKRTRPTPMNAVPTGLTGVKKLVFFDEVALALKQDGTVIGWGDPTVGQVLLDIPPGLRAADIAVGTFVATALTTDGRLVQWGEANNQAGRPEGLDQPGSVKAIAGAYGAAGTMAWLADDSLVTWRNTKSDLPETMATVQPLLLGSSTADGFIMVDQDRKIHQWLPSGTRDNPARDDSGLVPAGLNGRSVAYAALGYGYSLDHRSGGAVIVTKMLQAASPRVTGAARVGSVLTGVQGEFSASPDDVTNQWLANGIEIAGATGPTLNVTAAMAGQKITYRSTATKSGESAVSSTSAAVTVAKPAPSVVASTTKVSKVTVAKKAASVSVTGTVSASKAPAGKAKVTIKKGRKSIVVKTVAVSAKGAVKLTVKKFAKLVAKVTKAKGKKAKTAYRGAYTVTVNFLGNAQVKPSAGAAKFKVKR